MQQGTKRDLINTSLGNMLGSVDPKVAELVQQKYKEDEDAFVEAAKDACPSDAPSYWSKRSCNRCHGSGIMGRKYVFRPGESARRDPKQKGYSNSMFTTELTCSCSGNRYGRWLKEFRKFYNALKEQIKEGDVQHA